MNKNLMKALFGVLFTIATCWSPASALAASCCTSVHGTSAGFAVGEQYTCNNVTGTDVNAYTTCTSYNDSLGQACNWSTASACNPSTGNYHPPATGTVATGCCAKTNYTGGGSGGSIGAACTGMSTAFSCISNGINDCFWSITGGCAGATPTPPASCCGPTAAAVASGLTQAIINTCEMLSGTTGCANGGAWCQPWPAGSAQCSAKSIATPTPTPSPASSCCGPSAAEIAGTGPMALSAAIPQCVGLASDPKCVGGITHGYCQAYASGSSQCSMTAATPTPSPAGCCGPSDAEFAGTGPTSLSSAIAQCDGRAATDPKCITGATAGICKAWPAGSPQCSRESATPTPSPSAPPPTCCLQKPGAPACFYATAPNLIVPPTTSSALATDKAVCLELVLSCTWSTTAACNLGTATGTASSGTSTTGTSTRGTLTSPTGATSVKAASPATRAIKIGR